jgi:C1A family cysteine protease
MSDEHYFGWVDDQEAVAEIAAQLPIPSFGDTPANNITDIPDKVMPWTIKVLPARSQGNVGSCVSFGTARPVEYTHLVEISKGDKEQFKSLSRETIYGGSRVEIGGSRFSSDGSTGAWGSQFVQKYGTLFEQVYGKYDLTNYSVDRAKAWGKTGVPNDLEPAAAKHKVGTITKINNAEEAIKALANGYFINVCSSRGFELRRNAEGICRPSSVWQHSMSVIGMKKYGSSRLFCIENSWGPNSTTGPLVDLPNGACWWVTYEIMDKMFSQGDSWAYSNYEGFPINNINWRF